LLIFVLRENPVEMNERYIFIVRFNLALLIALCFAPDTYGQGIPNADFENWTAGKPDSWNCTNMSVLFTQFTTVFQETGNPQHGASCARLETETQNIFLVGPVTVPGLLTLGELKIDPVRQTANISGGTPFTGMPQALGGYFKYQPTTGDRCFIFLELTKWNNGVRDTIGYSYLSLGETANEWTAFNVPLEYLKWESPDTMNIGLVSSNITDGLPHAGTKFWVDNLSLQYGPVSIEGVTFPSGLKVFADGNNRRLIVKPEFDKQENVQMSVYSIGGSLLIQQSAALQQTEVAINLHALAPGIYIFRADISPEKSVSRKFSILY
jgi:hypothetical protein